MKVKLVTRILRSGRRHAGQEMLSGWLASLTLAERERENWYLSARSKCGRTSLLLHSYFTE